MFDDTLRNDHGAKYKIVLLKGDQPYHNKSFLFQKYMKKLLRLEIIG